MTPLSRRHFLSALAIPPSTPAELPEWKDGTLEIHHISTGRGNCTLILAPDGSTFLIDAGDVHRAAALELYYVTARPSSALRPGQWLARYLRRHLKRAKRSSIDTFFLTHLHGDHMGSIASGYPSSRYGNYLLTGIGDVAEEIEVSRIIDRGWPSYDYPTPLIEEDQKNYIRFVHNSAARGVHVEAFRPGSGSQFALRKPSSAPSFRIRNLAANGVIWTGQGEAAESLFPPIASLSRDSLPSENMCSAAIRLDYGKFSYYSGGDMPWQIVYGEPGWRNIETAVARVAGPVTAAVANHHGFLDACGPEWVRALQPKCFIIHAWTSAHPTMPAIHNMLSQELYNGSRQVFSTAVRPESRIAVRELDDMASSGGHVILRVPSGGTEYEVYITSDADESDTIMRHFGPSFLG